MVERECALCTELGSDLQDAFYSLQNSSLTCLNSHCASGRAEFHSQDLLGRSEGSTSCFLFFERNLIFPCFWFSSAITICCCVTHFLHCTCYAQRRQIQCFSYEVFYLAKVFCGCILLLILSVTLRNKHIKYISHPAITSCFSCLILCFLFLLFLFHCKLL